MPDCTDCLNRLSGSKVYSSVDMHGAFHCVPLEKKSRPYTAFASPQGLYQFKR